ncbi:Putative TetR-family regulatory protein [Sodalis praecaptivus]|uniref:Putative TetR-family regulatory protein n=1 Tax=Sodalis praecaptivus TaxID=1239307 RepID=W0HXI0_9GAMM|nr:TetR/AcrR family transcriptional regulator [Sodalis praecaptivus]AHF77227.1 Putative TetR-family regulatory protein [Sodalis praecaptivus]
MSDKVIFVSRKQMKTRALMVEQAMALFAQGLEPGVAEVAEKAGVSRSTAYRYFPTQNALVMAMVEESLGPVMKWQPTQNSADERVRALLAFAWPRIFMHEGVLRAALKVSLEQWAESRKAGGAEQMFTRGNRLRLLTKALQPLAARLAPEKMQLLLNALAVIYGTESLVVLKDIGHCADEDVMAITEWMAMAMLEKALRDSQVDD